MSTDNNETIAAVGFDMRRLLVVLLRLLAIYWLVMGLEKWAILLDLRGGTPFTDLDRTQQVVTGLFAVADLVAAVGLWLIASWGAVVWLILALAEAVLYGLFAADFGLRPWLVGFHAASVFTYAVLTWLVERKS